MHFSQEEKFGTIEAEQIYSTNKKFEIGTH